MPIKLIHADITTLAVDVIVNAAAPALLGGGGVDAAIHRAAGTKLLEACRRLPETAPGVRCPPGAARLTHGFALPARYVIHTVGPIWRGGDHGEPALLARCYQQSLQVALHDDLHTIAFPAISCGAYGYPPTAAAQIAVTTLHAMLHELQEPPQVWLCYRNPVVQHALQEALSAV